MGRIPFYIHFYKSIAKVQQNILYKLTRFEYKESIALPKIDNETDTKKFKAIIESDEMMSLHFN